MTIDASMRRPAAIALAIYGTLVAIVGFFPTPVDRSASPLLRSALAALHRWGVPDWFDYDVVEFTANIALFVTFGVLAVLAFGRRRAWLAVLAGAAASATIEICQWLLLPARFPTGLDVLANTIGTVIGAAIGYGVLVMRAPAAGAPARAIREP